MCPGNELPAQGWNKYTIDDDGDDGDDGDDLTLLITNFPEI